MPIRDNTAELPANLLTTHSPPYMPFPFRRKVPAGLPYRPVIFAFTFTEEILGGIQQSHILDDALTSQRVDLSRPMALQTALIFFSTG